MANTCAGVDGRIKRTYAAHAQSMTQTQTQFKAPTADGRMMYPVDQPVFTGRTSMVTATPHDILARKVGHTNQYLLIVAADVTEFVFEVAGRQQVIAWERTGASALLPETLSVPDFASFSDTFGTDDDGDPLAESMYRRVYGPANLVEHRIDLTGYTDFPANMLDPQSFEDPEVSLSWEVSAPYLIFGNAFAPALPGAIVKFREQLAKEIDELLPGVTIWTHKAKDGMISGHVTLAYEDGRTHTVKDGRKTRTRTSSMSWSFDFPVPATINGTSKADAVARYNELRDGIISEIVSKEAVVCAHCDGAGILAADPAGR